MSIVAIVPNMANESPSYHERKQSTKPYQLYIYDTIIYNINILQHAALYSMKYAYGFSVLSYGYISR